MISRYTLPEMSYVWSEENRFKIMFDIELLVCESLANQQKIPYDAYKKIKEKATLDINRIKEIEKTTKHDVAAFVDQISETVGEEGKYIHFGLTSSDILDTATSVQLKQSCDLILKKLNKLKDKLKKKSIEYKFTPIIGRTHGIHAEPTTFGLKLLGWYSEIIRDINMLLFTKDVISYGKISGAVGNFAHINPETEKYVCKKLGLKPETVSTQVIPRDRYTLYFFTISLIASSIERFATEIRHLQRTEINELKEPFSKGQKGSSAMPHKQNPILCENICGLARLVRSYLYGSFENINLWHERDISHSSFERIALPDASIVIDFIIERFINIFSGLKIYDENMLKNLELTKGLIFSEKLLLKLIEKGVTRKQAYKLVQDSAFKSLKESKNFNSAILENRHIMKILTEKDVNDCFDIKKFFSNIDKIYKRTV